MAQTSVATSLTAAFAGMLYDTGPHDIITGYNAEASAEMPFGVVVNLHATADRGCELPDNAADVLAGIVVHEHGFSKGPSDPQLGSTGLKPKVVFGVLRKGRIWVTVENGVATRGLRGYVRILAGAGGSQEGAIRTTDPGGGEVIDATEQIVFLTTCSAGGLAVADVDFTNKP